MLLADASFDDIVAMAPVLVLQALPVATCAELSVTRPGQRRPIFSSANRPTGSAVAAVPANTRILALQICLEEQPDAGVLRLSTRGAAGFEGAAAVTAAVLASLLESALDHAVASELADIAAHVIQIGESRTPPRLRLVDPWSVGAGTPQP